MSNSAEAGENSPHHKLLITFVGMPGAGKSEATAYLEQKKFPFARFGDITEEEMRARELDSGQENERLVREDLRREFGMGAYAIKMHPKIDSMLQQHDVIVLDGLYSWEEYTYLKPRYPGLVLVHIFAEPTVRYKRLNERPIRPLTDEEALARDRAEIENLNKGGPIAIADYLIENNTNDKSELFGKLDILLGRLGIQK